MPPPAAIIAYWRRADVPGRRIDPIAITLFFAFACAWSYLAARWGEIRLLGYLPRIDGTVLIGFGPLLGAVVAGSIRRHETWPMGFRGLDKRWSMAALAIPILVAAFVGVARFHVEPHLDAALIMASVVIGAIGQEVGWREWLSNALAGLPLWASALITWALWLAWHATFFRGVDENFSFGFIAALLVASFALAAIVRETRASAFAAGWHAAAAASVPLWQAAIALLLLTAVTLKGATALRLRLSAAYPDSRPPTS